MNGSPGRPGASRALSHHDAGADVCERAVVAPSAEARAARPAREHGAAHREQRRVLARVVGARLVGVDAVVGGDHEQILLAHAPEQAGQVSVDLPQGAGEAAHVLAVTVELVGLDQVREHEPAGKLGLQLGDALQGARVARPGVGGADPHAGEQVVDLADGVDLHAIVAELLEVAAARRKEREVSPSLGAQERSGRAGEGPRDHAPDGVLAAHRGAGGRARAVELPDRDPLDVGRQLQHRVLGGVEDQGARAQVLGTELLDRGEAVVGAVADELVPDRGDEHRADLRREAARVSRQRRLPDHAHQLPVPADRVLARTEGMQTTMDGGVRARRHPAKRNDRAQSEHLERRQIQATERLGEVRQRVGPRVAVCRRVRQRAHAARVDHQHERPSLLRWRDPVHRRMSTV